MKQSEISFEENNIISTKTNLNYNKRKIIKNNSNSYYLIIISIKLLVIFVINLYQTIKIERQNKILNTFSNVQKNLNDIILNFLDNRKRNFLIKLLKKFKETKNIMLLYNYIKLDNLFKDDQRYDGARNCLVQTEFNSSCLYNYLNIKKVKGKTRKLFGGKKSTSYVMLDEFDGIKICYSFGIGPLDWHIEFDKELADRNIDVYMYDHTIDKIAYKNPKFHFHKIGITGKNKKDPMLKPLEEILKENGHLNEKDMILKVDVEHSEWESFVDFPEELLKNFRFLLFEFHFANKDLDIYAKVLAKLNKYHQAFYAHCVNCGGVVEIGDIRICSALEVSYIIKEGHEFEIDDSIYPIPELDTKCNKNKVLDFNDNIFKYFDY